MFFTHSGKIIDFGAPQIDPRCISAADIAWQLSMVTRFGGAGLRRYSVLQHSLVVARLATADIRRIALLHDAAEAYMGDITSPLKRLLTGCAEIEKRVLGAIYDALAVRPPTEPDANKIRELDRRTLSAEARLVGPPGLWAYLGSKECDVTERTVASVLEMSDEQCRNEFLNGLTNEIQNHAP